MKLLYIANARIPTEKAHGIQIMKMCEAFAHSGVKVELVVPWRFNPIKEDPFQYYGVKNIFKIITIPSIDLVSLGRLGFLVQSLSFTSFAVLYVLFKKNDVLYSRDELALFFISFFKHSFFWEAHINKWNFIVRRVVRNAMSTIVITRGLKNFFLAKDVEEEKVLVAHDGVDLAMFEDRGGTTTLRKQYGISPTKKVIGHIGKLRTMGKEKGVEEILVAFSSIVKTIPEAFLLLVGPNEGELPNVYNLLRDLGISTDSYKVVAHVPQRDIPPFVHMSDVLVMYYPATGHYTQYMSPLKLFEYMASGRPIVASDLPSIREVLNEQNAVLVEAGNALALQHGIIKVLNSKLFRENIAKQALRDIQHYSWNKRAEAIIATMKFNLKQ